MKKPKMEILGSIVSNLSSDIPTVEAVMQPH